MFGEVLEVLDVERRERQAIGKGACGDPRVSVEDYPVHVASGEVCVTHRGDMSEKGIQFLVGVEDAVLSEIIGRRYRPYAPAPCLLVDRLDAVILQPRRIVSSIRGHCHPQ
jgi:hypothetical protein